MVALAKEVSTSGPGRGAISCPKEPSSWTVYANKFPSRPDRVSLSFANTLVLGQNKVSSFLIASKY